MDMVAHAALMIQRCFNRFKLRKALKSQELGSKSGFLTANTTTMGRYGGMRTDSFDAAARTAKRKRRNVRPASGAQTE